MADYKEMYLIMARAVRDSEEMHKQADQLLIDAMRKCEEMYIDAEESEPRLIYINSHENETKG